jgi:putative DNA primase/helicase
LRGARLVITSETEEGQRLREAKLKRVTQGMGEIKTARKYENPITFPETHKLWLDCNHRPVIRGADDAIWNRIIPIPCIHQVSEAEKDSRLREKLLLEREAIASWTVAGAVRWHTEGLGRPEIILRTRKEWREDMDVMGKFIEDCCLEEAESSVEGSALYGAFCEWAKKQGYEHKMTQTSFGTSLVERGFQKDKHPTTRRAIYRGLRLRSLFWEFSKGFEGVCRNFSIREAYMEKFGSTASNPFGGKNISSGTFRRRKSTMSP